MTPYIFPGIKDNSIIILNLIKHYHLRSTTLPQLIEFINQLCDVDITQKTKQRQVILARFLYYALSKEIGYSLHQIGDSLKFDHTTVLHGSRQVYNTQDKEMNNFLLRISQRVEEVVFLTTQYYGDFI